MKPTHLTILGELKTLLPSLGYQFFSQSWSLFTGLQLSGNRGPFWLQHVYSKSMSSYAPMEFHVFQFVPVVSSSVTDNHCKSLAPSSSLCPTRYFQPFCYSVYGVSAHSASPHTKKCFKQLM